MQFFYEDGTGNIVDDQGQQATTFIEEKSFRLKSLTDLRKCIKNKNVQVDLTTMHGTMMSEATPRKERPHQYNVYTIEDRKRYFYFLKEKLMKPREAAKAAKAANVNYDTARKWKKTYEEDPEREIPTKKNKSWFTVNNFIPPPFFFVTIQHKDDSISGCSKFRRWSFLQEAV
ncbi:hypothetical protein CU098_008558 [Rhizopus stolonifer]|uniref:Uncharacterized protein n=1 Tax=Rhizopus stolonifer TaxID=4846 RepID=A0A367IYT6_RHIST|nr:hypothetical protein CU098_008558 [Rhizopus stolonifer]